MLQSWVIIPVALAYLGTLFAIAYYGDQRADQGRSIIANPYIYALSLGVYATAWTFYGSVGRAAADGIGFLPIYIGPTLMMALWWVVMRKIIRISKANRITSLADFVSSRYGKSAALAGLVTIIAVIGVVPYIALQLKAVSHSFTILVRYPEVAMAAQRDAVPILADTAFWVALVLATFTILFGTRHLDASERHEGLVAAIAFESIVKLVAFLAVGLFVTYGIYDGLADLFARAATHERLAALFAPLNGAAGSYASWASLTLLSMCAIMFLPRQFQIAVVENVNENHLGKAIWLFPLYMLAMNVFVIPAAFGGLMHFSGAAVDPDTFVLTLPMSEKQEALALLVFIGGLSAATGMVIVETIALSTMVCNDLVMPVLLRIPSMRLAERRNLTGLLLGIRRGAIVAVVLLGYFYFRLAGEAYALVAIGLISFAAVAQFAPAVIGGIYWKGATRAGALAGLSAGFIVWLHTLLLPSFAKSGWLPIGFVEHGPFGIALLKPYALFGLEGLNDITHAMLWSALANVGAFVLVSVLTRQSVSEQAQAARFVDVFRHGGEGPDVHVWKGSASLPELRALLSRFLGPERADAALAEHAQRRGVASPEQIRRGRGAGPVRGNRARGRHRRRLRAHHGGVDGQGGRAVAGRGPDDAGRGVAGHRLQPRTRAQVARTDGGDGRAARRQRAAEGTRPAEGRFRLDGHPRVAHAAHVDPRVFRDPPRQPGTRRGRAAEIPQHHHPGKRAAHPPHQPGAGSRQAGIGPRRMAGRRDRREGGRRGLDRRDRTAVPREERRARDTRLPETDAFVRADRDRLVQVLINLLSNAVKFVRPDEGRVVVRVDATAGMLRVVRRGQRAGHRRRRPAGDLREVPPGG